MHVYTCIGRGGELCCGIVRWGTKLQAGRSRVRLSMEIIYWLNPSGRTMALGSTQPLTEMNTRNVSWGKESRCVELTTWSPSCASCLEILGASTSWSPKGLSTPVLEQLYPYIYAYVYIYVCVYIYIYIYIYIYVCMYVSPVVTQKDCARCP